MKTFPLLCILAFVGSALIGWILQASLRSTDTTDHNRPLESPPQIATAIDEEPVDVPTDEIQPIEIPEEPQDFAQTHPRDPLQGSGLLAIPEGSVADLRISALGVDGNLSKEIIEFLSLDSGEADRLNASLDDARDSLNAMELDRMEVVSSSPDELVLHIPAFEEGLETEAALKAKFIRELGETDGELLWEFMAERNRSAGDYWHGFGRVSREVAFRMGPSDQNPDARILHISSETPADEQQKWLESDGINLGNYTSEVHRVPSPEWAQRILGRYEYLLPLLPEEVVSFLTPPGEVE